jgi:hypothetical protein
MFQASLPHPQEALNQDWSGTSILVQPTDITRTQYTKQKVHHIGFIILTRWNPSGIQQLTDQKW